MKILLRANWAVSNAPGVVGKPNDAVPVKYAEPFRSTAIADALTIPPMCPPYRRADSVGLNFAMNIMGELGLPMEFPR
jgi:hypothetical protein